VSARTRSPNYPSMSLGQAIEAMKKVYAQERRSKFPRMSLANHLGYTSINGRSLAKIGAIRAYGLIDGREDALSVSQTALAILEAPAGSPDSVNAHKVAFLNPTIFQKAHEEYGAQRPSPQTFRWWLTQQGYVGEAADKAMESYLDSLDLVNSLGPEYELRAPQSVESDAEVEAPRRREAAPLRQQERVSPTTAKEVSMGVQERVLQAGLLSKGATYRVLVSGHIGKAEFDKLIAKLQMDADILTDDEDEAGRPDDEDLDPFA
jgi:hypothetical protein